MLSVVRSIQSHRLGLFKLLIAFAVILLLVVVMYEAWPERPRGQVIDDYGGIRGQVRRTPGLDVQFWHDGELFATSGHSVFRSQDNGLAWERVAVLGFPKGSVTKKVRHWVAGLKLYRRFRPEFNIGHLRVLKSGTVLVVDGAGIFRGTLATGEIVRLEHVYSFEGAPLSQGWTEDRQGVVYVGQYLVDYPGRSHVASNLYWSRDQGRTWSVRQRFPRAEIRHIHAAEVDPYHDLLWLATGDTDAESRILYSSDQGASFRILGSGNQDWRTVSLQFTPQAIYWGTDSPHSSKNYLFQWVWKTGERQILLTTSNPLYYSTQDGRGNLFFSSTVEQEESSSRQFSELWEIPALRPRPVRLGAWRKGALRMWAQIEFAQGAPATGWIAFTPLNLAGHHHETLVMEAPR